MEYETATEIGMAIANWFGIRKFVSVPNISWGFFSDRECDLIVINKTGYAYEVEIKISKSDLIKDKEKWHHHSSVKLQKLWFAIPEKLEKCIDLIPEQAGIFVVLKSGYAKQIRQPTRNKTARKLTDIEQFQIARLGTIRMWREKFLVKELEGRIKKLKEKDING
jgi:hypothetical protein